MYATRNDRNDPQASSLERVTCSLKLLLHGLQKYGLSASAEVLLVDWASEQPIRDIKELPQLVRLPAYPDSNSDRCSSFQLVRQKMPPADPECNP